MNLAQARKSIKNLKKVKGIVEVSKFTTLQELSRIAKVTNTALEFSVIAKEVFEKAARKYKIKSKFYSSAKRDRTLWVYIATNKTLLSTSNESLEKMLVSSMKSGDKLITIGKSANDFASDANFDQELSFVDEEVNIIELASSISTIFETGKLDTVKVIYHSGTNEPTVILPIADASIEVESKINISSKSKFFPSLHEAMDIISHTYVMHTMSAIISQSRYFATKEKLIRHEQSIKAIDEKIEEKKVASIKYGRKVSTEELILITGNAKRNSKTGGANEK